MECYFRFSFSALPLHLNFTKGWRVFLLQEPTLIRSVHSLALFLSGGVYLLVPATVLRWSELSLLDVIIFTMWRNIKGDKLLLKCSCLLFIVWLICWHWLFHYRYEKRHSNIPAHIAPCFRVKEGDHVIIGQCRFIHELPIYLWFLYTLALLFIVIFLMPFFAGPCQRPWGLMYWKWFLLDHPQVERRLSQGFKSRIFRSHICLC